jgi:hypothetical protein
MTDERPPIRIGTAERTAAMKALDEHLAAGRLEIEEYGERSALAVNATTVPELAALFDDLPAPHPQLPGVGVPTDMRWGPLPAVTYPAAPPAPRGPSTLEVWGPRLMAASPFIALGLFLILHTWVVFLLIPVMGAVLGSQHRSGHRGADHRRRDRRRPG